MTDPRNPGRPARLAGAATVLGPEAVGGLAALLVLIAVIVVARPADGGAPTPTPTPGPASPAASAGGTTSSPRASSTLAPWAGRASTLLDVEAQLVEQRDAMAALLDPPPGRADDLAEALRGANGQLLFALDVIDGLEDEGLDADLVGRLRSAHQSALDASLDGLDASLTNVDAYVATTTTVVAALADLETMATELARVSGLPPPVF